MSETEAQRAWREARERADAESVQRATEAARKAAQAELERQQRSGGSS